MATILRNILQDIIDGVRHFFRWDIDDGEPQGALSANPEGLNDAHSSVSDETRTTRPRSDSTVAMPKAKKACTNNGIVQGRRTSTNDADAFPMNDGVADDTMNEAGR